FSRYFFSIALVVSSYIRRYEDSYLFIIIFDILLYVSIFAYTNNLPDFFLNFYFFCFFCYNKM
ncbi:hypothetical protein J7L48_06455, partial [bacterium]|nr:hypothetical protein [bacterium]